MPTPIPTNEFSTQRAILITSERSNCISLTLANETMYVIITAADDDKPPIGKSPLTIPFNPFESS